MNQIGIQKTPEQLLERQVSRLKAAIKVFAESELDLRRVKYATFRILPQCASELNVDTENGPVITRGYADASYEWSMPLVDYEDLFLVYTVPNKEDNCIPVCEIRRYGEGGDRGEVLQVKPRVMESAYIN